MRTAYSTNLENIRQIAKIKNVVKLDSGWKEDLRNSLMKSKSCIDQDTCTFLYCHAELVDLQVLCVDTVVDRFQSFFSRETQSENAEVTLLNK